MWYVYMLKCNDNTYYTGCTNNLEDRIRRHNNNEIHYTKSRLPVVLETYIAFNDKYEAYKFEKYLKSGSGKAFMFKRFVEKL
ncbi:MAG: GIY-YIG nuclease family protein [Bacteroidota bacterium]